MINLKLMCPICGKKDFAELEEQEKYDNEIVKNTCNKIINMLKSKRTKCKDENINEVLELISNNNNLYIEENS